MQALSEWLQGRNLARSEDHRQSRLGAAGGLEPPGQLADELADGSVRELPFAVTEIEFMGEITGGRVIFAPDGVEPILGVAALESVGIEVDPRNQTLKRLPAISLK